MSGPFRMNSGGGFHLAVNPAQEKPLQSLYETGYTPFWEKYGGELFVDLVTSLHGKADARRALVNEFRQHWWWVRNHRAGAGLSPKTRDAIVGAMECYELLAWAGCDRFDLHRLVDCLSESCSCEGCDLANGKRFAAAVVSQGR